MVSTVSTLEGHHCIILYFAHTCIEGTTGSAVNVGKATRIFYDFYMKKQPIFQLKLQNQFS